MPKGKVRGHLAKVEAKLKHYIGIHEWKANGSGLFIVTNIFRTETFQGVSMKKGFDPLERGECRCCGLIDILSLCLGKIFIVCFKWPLIATILCCITLSSGWGCVWRQHWGIYCHLMLCAFCGIYCHLILYTLCGIYCHLMLCAICGIYCHLMLCGICSNEVWKQINNKYLRKAIRYECVQFSIKITFVQVNENMNLFLG